MSNRVGNPIKEWPDGRTTLNASLWARGECQRWEPARPRAEAACTRAMPSGPLSRHSFQRTQPGDLPSDDQGLNIVSAFVGIHCLKVQHVANDRIIRGDAVTAEEFTRQPRAVERDTHIIALCHRDLSKGHLLLVLQSAELVRHE